MEPTSSDHNRVDARSLAMHRLIARKLAAAPALLDKARETLRRWQSMEGSPQLTLSEWETILRRSPVQVARFLVERSEKATRLRQSSPFTGILSEAERRAIHESYSARTHRQSSQPNRG